jgi:hypothetical protein
MGQCVGDNWDPRLDNFAPAAVKGKPDEIRAWAIEGMKTCAKAAQILGVDVVTCFLGSPIWAMWYSFPQTTPEMVEAGFQSDNHMLMFPAGLCSRRKNGEVRDIDWKKTFIAKSVEYKRDVVPIHFSGQNSNRFYRLANFSDRFLPFNFAMLFLVDEMYKNVHKTFRVTIGKPIPWQTFDHSRKPAEWAQWVKDRVYELGLGSTSEKEQ